MSYPAWFCVSLWTVLVYIIASVFNKAEEGSELSDVASVLTFIMAIAVVCVGCWSLHGMVLQYKAFVP